ncbi:hypothetical protein, partial [Leclercia adecarboxylata]|uniref:hypothetical protein n=1 Tax=Leclercia adecarboxylata TaxID=83655 RepID=UPI00234DDF22
MAGSRETFDRSNALVDDTVIATQPDVQASAAPSRQASVSYTHLMPPTNREVSVPRIHVSLITVLR